MQTLQSAANCRKLNNVRSFIHPLSNALFKLVRRIFALATAKFPLFKYLRYNRRPCFDKTPIAALMSFFFFSQIPKAECQPLLNERRTVSLSITVC